jgi:phospholipid/cholesterol/gamma-HCH transport system substrate-binding protein
MERKGAEVYVGLFLLIGLSIIAAMVVTFGKVGQGFAKTYQVTVEFPNASGLVKGADILLAGARIGHATSAPYLVVKEGFTVGVKLDINDGVKIPKKSSFVVNQAGLLGDVYIDVIPPLPDQWDPNKAEDLVQPGDTIIGRQRPGLEDLQQKGGVVLEKLASELDEIKTATNGINDLFSKENVKNLSDTFENLNKTSANLGESSKKLDPIFTKADGAMDSAKEAMATFDKAAADLRTALTDFKKVSDSAGRTLDSANKLFQKAERGDGPLGMLLSDREAADNLKALISNMRRSGPVFYKDRAPEPTPAPKKR